MKQIGGQVMYAIWRQTGTDEGFCNGRDHTAGIFNDLSRSFRNGMLDIDLKNGNLIARKVPVGLSTRILFPVTVLLVPLWCRA